MTTSPGRLEHRQDHGEWQAHKPAQAYMGFRGTGTVPAMLPTCRWMWLLRDVKGGTVRYSEQLCPRYQRAVEILGKRWTGLIIKLLLDSPLRFNELSRHLEIVSDRMLSERLKELEQEGVIERHVYTDTPVRVEYRLTDKGHALNSVVIALEQWATDWISLAEPAVAEQPNPALDRAALPDPLPALEQV